MKRALKHVVVMINVNTILMYVVHKKTLNLTLTQQLDILILDVLCFLNSSIANRYFRLKFHYIIVRIGTTYPHEADKKM